VAGVALPAWVPQAELRDDELVTTSERRLCATPVNTHFNLALRLVERFAGRDLALHCAKVLLVDANRPSQRPTWCSKIRPVTPTP